jgi:hypothetical protein
MDVIMRKQLITNGEQIEMVVESYALEVLIVGGNSRGGGVWRVLFRSKYPTGPIPFVLSLLVIQSEVVFKMLEMFMVILNEPANCQTETEYSVLTYSHIPYRWPEKNEDRPWTVHR